MASKILLGALAAAVAASLCLATQTPLQTLSSTASIILSPEYHAWVEEVRKDESIPGVSIGVVRLGEDSDPQVQFASWGQKTEDGDGHDLTPDTLFCLASCSKAFVSASLGMLMDDFALGRNATPLPSGLAHFDWDTKVADVLPRELEWSLHSVTGDDWATRKASIRDVLGHVSGLPRHDYTYVPGDTTGDIVRRMSGLRTAYELREKYSYNNQMYMLGAHLISTYSNMSYPDFVSKRIFEPLRMSSSTFRPSVAKRSGKLTHAWFKNGRRIPYWFDDEVAKLNAGPGGVISSAEDMVKWLAALLNKGVDPVSGKTVFSQSVYDAVTTARWIVPGAPIADYGQSIVGYGMGWERWDYEGIEVVCHPGGDPGVTTLTAFSPSNNVGVVILTNTDDVDSIFPILKRTLDEVLGREPSSEAAAHASPESETPYIRSAESTAPSLHLDAYTGTYSAKGYPLIQLCSSSNTTEYCADVLSDFAALVSSPLSADLYATYRSIWSTHLRLTHFYGDIFNLTFMVPFPEGYGKDTSAFELSAATGWVEFSVEDNRVEGFSLVIDEDAVAARNRRTGGELPETADAWFSKA